MEGSVDRDAGAYDCATVSNAWRNSVCAQRPSGSALGRWMARDGVDGAVAWKMGCIDSRM